MYMSEGHSNRGHFFNVIVVTTAGISMNGWCAPRKGGVGDETVVQIFQSNNCTGEHSVHYADDFEARERVGLICWCGEEGEPSFQISCDATTQMFTVARIHVHDECAGNAVVRCEDDAGNSLGR